MEIIEVSHFRKRFGSKLVHEDVTFTVNKGECLGLLGGSGAGKSVILRSLIGLERPDSGKIVVEGIEVTGRDESELIDVRKRVAYVFQNGALFDSMTVFDNIAYPLREHTDLGPQAIRDRVLEILQTFNLQGSESLLPAELSGGMQKRVGLARAIILKPDVILYDEPTAGLDPANTITIQNLIIQLKSTGVTSILVTHDLDTALRVCDRLAFLENGHVEDLGAVADLKEDPIQIMQLFVRGKSD